MKYYNAFMTMGIIGFSTACGDSDKDDNIETASVIVDNDGDGFKRHRVIAMTSLSIFLQHLRSVGMLLTNNCDGNIDEPEAVDDLFYKDGDGDGFGLAELSKKLSNTLTGYGSESQNQRFDCDDENAVFTQLQPFTNQNYVHWMKMQMV